MVVQVYLHSVVEGATTHSSNSIASERISYYLLRGGGGLRRSKLGLDLDLVATKHWLAPTGLLRVPSLLKPAVR